MSLRRLFERRTSTQSDDAATLEDVELAYRLILKRAPDASGLEDYTARIAAGLPLGTLIQELLTSDERRARSTREASDVTSIPASEGDSEAGADSARTLISPADVVRRYSVEELLETADEYYRRIDDATPLLQKPFAFLQETPEMLENLGAVLRGLRLGKGMTVLDFGAGSGWLTRILSELNCQAICCDSSIHALEIARELFRRHPPIGPHAVPPVILPFDGHRLTLGDESVDRIVCFDAFHHVPNQAAVLSEFARVLRPGGIAGFSEPGRAHSRSPQAQFEMRNHRVLENDVDLEAIDLHARSAGFTSLTVRVLSDDEIPLSEYVQAFARRERSVPIESHWANVSENMLNRSIFFLHKGPPRPDSRSHVGLAHRIELLGPDLLLTDGGEVTLTFRITNTGTSLWLHTSIQIHGIVRLGSHLYDSGGKPLNMDHSRHDLPRSLPPGDAIDLTVTVPVPSVDTCHLAFDLVAEGVRWFENEGSLPVRVTVRRVVQTSPHEPD